MASVVFADNRLPAGIYKSPNGNNVLHVKSGGDFVHYSSRSQVEGFVDFSTEECMFKEADYPHRTYFGNLMAYGSGGTKYCFEAKAVGERIILTGLANHYALSGIWVKGNTYDIARVKEERSAHIQRYKWQNDPFGLYTPTANRTDKTTSRTRKPVAPPSNPTVKREDYGSYKEYLSAVRAHNQKVMASR